MKRIPSTLSHVVIFLLLYSFSFAAPSSGFFLPDSVSEMTISYRSAKNMIILPVKINDSISVNLILDTGCRNLVLFGKRFQKFFKFLPGTKVQFSGLGSGKPVMGRLSLYNKVSIHEVLGERIPVVVVPEKNVLSLYDDVDGVIGYDIFQKFEIEVNPRDQIITFRPAMKTIPSSGFTQVPLEIVDSRPVMRSVISFREGHEKRYELMIDTGSALALLMKTTNRDDFPERGRGTIIGAGFNGPITGFSVNTERLRISGLEIESVSAAIVESPWHNYASVGMEVLKDYILVLNYCQAYACFKKLDA